jgi:hydroxymethylpyrimidine/phosphomethylpyrimidine kinase
MERPVALTVAGSDPSGGAGLQADLKTFHQHGVYGCAAATLLTVQSTVGVEAVHLVAPELVAAQVRAVLEDLPVAVLKTGALGSLAIARALAEALGGRPLPWVLDPVMVSTSGRPLLVPQDAVAVADLLFPKASLVTPNLDEASFLLGRPVLLREELLPAARELSRRWDCAVLLKGGHLERNPCEALVGGTEERLFEGARIETRHSHGTGCVLASAIAARLAWGDPLVAAVEAARDFVTRALAGAPGLGAGHGPMDLFART